MFKKINFLQIIIPIISVLIISGITSCSKNDTTSPYSSMNSNTGGTGVPGANEVWMQSSAFTPASITVAKGTTIKWTNKDNVLHTVTSGVPNAPDGLFDSGNIANGGTFSFQFNTVGTFQYYCRVHQDIMKGQVIVQ